MKKIIRLTELDLVSTINKIIAEHKFITEISDLQSPYEKLMTCKFTSDGKHVVYEGKAYSTINGNEVLINENWSLSDILHTGADLLSAGMDFVIPGSGAVVDILNALSYIIEAQFKSEKERDSLYIMAAITFAFVIMPGPLQAIAIPLKRAVKTGVGLASKIVVKGLKIVAGILDTILLKLPSKIKSALQSPLAKTILGKFRGKITGFIDSFTSRIKQLLSKITGKTAKKTVSGNVDNLINTELKVLNAGPVSPSLLPAIINKTKTLENLPAVTGAGGLIQKIGFTKGTTFGKYVIDDIIEDAIIINSKRIKTWDFIKTYILKPSAKLNVKFVPALVKIIVRSISNNGTIDTNAIKRLPIEQIKKELEYLQTLVANYEGDSGYTVNTNAQNIQKALLALGYQLPNAGADGKFGPETKTALEEFQSKNGLTTSKGKMDRLTAKKLAEKLKSKNVEPELQNYLNKM